MTMEDSCVGRIFRAEEDGLLLVRTDFSTLVFPTMTPKSYPIKYHWKMRRPGPAEKLMGAACKDSQEH